MGQRIILLDDQTANRIAAGEVVERPASAVKELVENAIDAQATRIVIRLIEGGKRLIEVSDNGWGMDEEDAILSLQRHATSKIRTSDDLFAVRTLGFRGEALPSIASVSLLTLTTKSAEADAATRVHVRGGIIEAVEPAGAADGTTVVVENLFYNTPARLKFLKTTPTETARCVEVVAHLALAHPDIAVRLVSEEQAALATPGNGDLLDCVATVWGRDAARKALRVEGSFGSVRVHGYVCAPDFNRPGRTHELFFVNRRPIRSRLLAHALEDAVRAFTPDGRYPVAVIFLEMDPRLVDVNVHPTKSEVKFERDHEVHHAVNQAVKNALQSESVSPTLTLGNRAGLRYQPASAATAARPSISPEAYRAAVDAFRPTEADPGAGAGLARGNAVPGAANLSTREELRGYRVLGQVQNTYIVAVTDRGIAIIDQHVAHERVLYERLSRMRQAQPLASQRLTEPFSLSLGSAEATLLRQRLEDFAAMGWDLEPFGRDAFLVRAVPVYASRRAWDTLLRDMVDELVHQSVARRLVVQRDHVTITNACKMAVKAGDPLTLEEMEGLIAQLADTENPHFCPHGRPAVVTIPFHEIDREFKRA
ncbi:MAG: DNA mismatch repair endonuclease MutL [Chthonomonadales bacterium]